MMTFSSTGAPMRGVFAHAVAQEAQRHNCLDKVDQNQTGTNPAGPGASF